MPTGLLQPNHEDSPQLNWAVDVKSYLVNLYPDFFPLHLLVPLSYLPPVELLFHPVLFVHLSFQRRLFSPQLFCKFNPSTCTKKPSSNRSPTLIRPRLVLVPRDPTCTRLHVCVLPPTTTERHFLSSRLISNHLLNWPREAPLPTLLDLPRSTSRRSKETNGWRATMSSPKRRIETDVMKLMMSDYEVTLVNDNMQEFYVIFKGPSESKTMICPRHRAWLINT